MEVARVERKLSAILAADIAGYSRLVSANDEETLHSLSGHRRELFDPLIAKYRGRIFKTTGDGLLAEFASVVDAVRCAAEVQAGMALRNARIDNDKRLEFRIGINVGDIIEQNGDIFGDGVNIAARLEGLAEPGGICVSERVQEDAAGKIALLFEDMGYQALKNIARPIRAYRLLQASAGLSAPSLPPALSLPSKPSIAILAFANMSGDPEQNYFADGISEDLITALSHIRWLFVIARNSSFVYRDQAVDVKQVSRDLGVRYVLEGSVRKSGNRIRITAQLIDALSGAHHWAERYDRDVTDIFTLQDEIVQQVVGAIEPRLFAAEGVRSQSRAPADLDAWDMVARAMSGYWRLTGPDIEEAIALLKEAAARFPNYAPAHSMLGFCLVLAGHWGWLPIFEIPRLALDSALRAVNLDESDPWAYLALGYVACVQRRTDDAVADFQKAIELNPNFAAAHGFLGFPLAFDGRSEDAIATLTRAMRMSPQDRLNTLLMSAMAVAHYTARRYDQAIEWSRKGVQQGPSLAGHHRILCASLAQAGHIDAARATLARIRELQPHISLDWVENMVPYTAEQMPHFLEGLTKAGLT